MLMQNSGGTNKEHYGMLWYFWSGQLRVSEGLQYKAVLMELEITTKQQQQQIGM